METRVVDMKNKNPPVGQASRLSELSREGTFPGQAGRLSYQVFFWQKEDGMKRKLLVTGLALILTGACALAAWAQPNPQVLVKQRQAAMILQGKYFGPLVGMAQGKVPYDSNVVARNAGYLDALSKMPWDGFATSTKDLKSEALPAVFKDAPKFKEAQDRLMGEAAKLVSVSKGGDEAAVKAQIGAVGKACGDCHGSFR